MAPWVAANLGKKVTMVFPDYAFGYDHRDFFSAAIAAQGGEVVELMAIPPTETSFTRYLPRIPTDTEVLYHVMVGPAVLTFVKELGEFYGGGDKPEIFGFIDSLEAVDLAEPGLEFLEGTHFWEGHPRYLQPDAAEHESFYRAAVGVDDNGAALEDAKDVSTYAHMFSAWETLFVIKAAMEAAGYQGPDDRQALVEAMEAMTTCRPVSSTLRATSSSTAGPTRSSATSTSPGSRRPARRRPHHLDRGRSLPGRGRLHHHELLTATAAGAARPASRPAPSASGPGRRADPRR